MSVEKNQLPEMATLQAWLGASARSPSQLFAINECDCELVKLPGGEMFLATTVDTLSEEIALGLYQDAYTVGWVAAMASLSDLAAVGAQPLGVLLSTSWGIDCSLAYKQNFSAGFKAALAACETFLLGGDNGRGIATTISSVGTGLCTRPPAGRVGAVAGDVLCLTGTFGRGPALMLSRILGLGDRGLPEDSYRPTARLAAGRALTPLAHSMMDTSDGIWSSLVTMSAVNGTGFVLEVPDAAIDPAAAALCGALKVPKELLSFMDHGDYQLLVAIPEASVRAAQQLVPDLMRIGRVTAAPDTCLQVRGRGPVALPSHLWSMDGIADGKEIRKRLQDLVTTLQAAQNSEGSVQ